MNSEITLMNVVVSFSHYEYIKLFGLITPKQIYIIIQNAKEDKDWFKGIEIQLV